jgi:hypothetical protein
MTSFDEAAAELAKLFSGPPRPKGKDRYQHLQYIPVERDGVIEFIRDPFQLEMRQMFDEILDEMFGPEPAEDVEPSHVLELSDRAA